MFLLISGIRGIRSASGRHPGRIYDAKREDLSPFGAIREWFSFSREDKKKDDGTEKV